MAYIGTSPSNGVRRVHTYTATANQTTFTGSSTEGVTLTYADTNYIDVFQNGVLLGSADYTSTSGTSVVLAQGASVSDLVVIVVYDVFSVADTVSKTSGGSFDSAVTMSSTLDVTGALSAKGGAVFNEDSADVDFRVESNGNANMLFVDGGNNHVNIGSSSDAGGVLNVSDGTSFSTGITVENTGDTHGSVIDFLNNSDSPADGDYIGGLIFKETNSASGTHQFAKIFGIAADITDGTEDGALTFETSAGGANTAERMRIDSDGRAYFNTTSALGTGVLNVKLAGTNKAVGIRLRAEDAGNWMIAFENSSGTVVGQIIANASSTSYNTSSDHRLKENVDYTFDATTRLKQLKPARFNFIADADTTVDGFLAHEVQSVVPEAITGTHNEVDDDGNAVMQSIDQSKLVPLLVKTIQELEARITALESGE
jgi:prepilin-type processing-associated H-X9-DG protein